MLRTGELGAAIKQRMDIKIEVKVKFALFLFDACDERGSLPEGNRVGRSAGVF
ncbi:MAG: hypothetical protein JO100_01520 [Pseudonocardia sp.]|nr:hypothetical protein [Pseudonocardia sp.]